MVSKANRYESIETENHGHESKKHAEKAEKIRVSTIFENILDCEGSNG